jgi:uncharacterized membrane protein YhhN
MTATGASVAPGRRAAGPLYVVLAAADAVFADTGRDRARRLTKPLLMPLLMVGRDRPTQRALALGGLGDVALLGSSSTAFTVGLGSFLAGHVAWVGVLRRRSSGRVRRHPWLAVPYLAAWAGLNAYLWPRSGRDRVPVLVYSAALVTTSLAALDTGDPGCTAGGVLFLASDALIALKRFAGLRLPHHEVVVMTTYTAAQALLARG